MSVDGKAILARCRERLARIDRTKDEGVFARMYAEDVPLLLGAIDGTGGDPPSDRLLRVHARVCGDGDHEHLTSGEAVDCVLDAIEHGTAKDPSFRTMLVQELSWHALDECDCTTVDGCHERIRNVTVELGLRSGRQ